MRPAFRAITVLLNSLRTLLTCRLSIYGWHEWKISAPAKGDLYARLSIPPWIEVSGSRRWYTSAEESGCIWLCMWLVIAPEVPLLVVDYRYLTDGLN